MRISIRVTMVTVAVLASACGGSKGASTQASAGSPSPGSGAASTAQSSVEESGVPRWVARGGGAVATSDGGAFYGVGSAAGIANPALLRTTAENRAREDLAKTMEVFSASLMKDYASSAGEQAVEQAVKTATSMALKGVEIVDHYIASDGAMFALARLGLDRYAEVLKASELGAAKSYTSKVDVHEMFKEKAAPAEEPTRAPAVAAADAGGAPAANSAASSAPERSGEEPAWVAGHDPRFPGAVWLCGVGYGSDRLAAENAAYAAISRIFSARVQSVARDFMGAYSKTGAQSLEVQSSEQLTEVSTQKVLSGVQIKEVYTGKGTIYALACLERQPTMASLKEAIQVTESTVGRHLTAAKTADKAGKVNVLGQALEELRRREALNGELRIVSPDGVGVQATYSHADVAAAFAEAVEALRIGVVAKGPYDGDLRGALIEGLTKRGYKVSEGGAADMDLLLTANIRLEDGGKGTGRMASLHYARGVVQVQLENVAQKKLLASLEESKKDGSRTLDEAERRVIRALGKTLLDQVAKKIEQAMLR